MPRSPQTPGEVIAHRFVGLQVDILRLSQSEREKVFRLLGQLQSRLLSKMDVQIPLPGFGTYNQQRLQALYRLTDRIISEQYEAIQSQQQDTLAQTAVFSGEQAVRSVNRSIGGSVITLGTTVEHLQALINDDLVDGRPARYWWDQQATDLKTRYRDEIRMGVFAGETQSQLKQRIRGTRARHYQDGILSLTSRQADALIRTSLISVANAARHEVYQANDDILSGEQWLATLDDRTCPICAALDQQAWSFEGDRLSGTTRDFPGPPPQHFNCRCTLIPLTKSWDEILKGASVKDRPSIQKAVPPAMRASMGGPVRADMTYDEWLRGQDEAVQRDILGRRRFELWRAGELNAQDFVDQYHRPLTLDQLRSREGRGGVTLAPLQERAVRDVKVLGEKGTTDTTAGANITYRVDFKDQSQAIFKPTSGELDELRPSIESGTYYKREVAAYEVAKIVEMLDLVPETIVKDLVVDGVKQTGSLQAFVPHSQTGYQILAREQREILNGIMRESEHNQEQFATTGKTFWVGMNKADLERSALFDSILGNTDRHSGNWMVGTRTNKLNLIDHGLTLPTNDEPLIIQFIGEGRMMKPGLLDKNDLVPDSIKEIWQGKWPKIEKALKAQGIERRAITWARKRYERAMTPGVRWGDLVQKVSRED